MSFTRIENFVSFSGAKRGGGRCSRTARTPLIYHCIAYVYDVYTYMTVVAAIQARVDTSEQVGDWMKLGVSVINIFKNGKDKIRRGDELVWVPVADFRCRCPRLRPRQTYLILGNELMSGSRPGVVVDRSSAVHKWREQLSRRVHRRIQRC